MTLKSKKSDSDTLKATQISTITTYVQNAIDFNQPLSRSVMTQIKDIQQYPDEYTCQELQSFIDSLPPIDTTPKKAPVESSLKPRKKVAPKATLEPVKTDSKVVELPTKDSAPAESEKKKVTPREYLEKVMSSAKVVDQMPDKLKADISYILDDFDHAERDFIAKTVKRAQDFVASLASKPAPKAPADPSKEQSVAATQPAEASLKPQKAPEKASAPAVNAPVKSRGNAPVASKKPAQKPLFPPTLDHTDLGTLIKTAEYTDFDSLKAAIAADADIYFVSYWDKSQLVGFDYAGLYYCKVPASGFKDDLDILQAIAIDDINRRVWAMSVYTGAMFRFEQDQLGILTLPDPRDPDMTMQCRFSFDLEFDLYTAQA